MTFRCEVPLPPIECSPNGSHRHWSVKQKARNEYRADCYLNYIAERHRLKEWTFHTRYRLSLDFYVSRMPYPDERYRPRDVANAISAFKGGQDALVDARLIPNDGHKHLVQGPVAIYAPKKAKDRRSCVVVTLEPIVEALKGENNGNQQSS
jgi:hypothetical protein